MVPAKNGRWRKNSSIKFLSFQGFPSFRFSRFLSFIVCSNRIYGRYAKYAIIIIRIHIMGMESYLQVLNMYRGYTIVYTCTGKGIGCEYIGIMVLLV